MVLKREEGSRRKWVQLLFSGVVLVIEEGVRVKRRYESECSGRLGEGV